MQPHVQRMVEEFDQLTERLDKLNDFRQTELFSGLHISDQYLLELQYSAMRHYQSALSARLAVEKSRKPNDASDDAKIDEMVSRFLSWRLPETFNPDAGITFEPDYNVNTPHPMRHEPTGTNLFNFTEAKAMVLHILGRE